MSIAMVIHVVTLMALSACSVPYAKIDGWPRLTIREHEVSFLEMLDRCWKTLADWQKATGFMPLACVEIDLAAHTCDIFFVTFPNMRDHELQHCAGLDHGGTLAGQFDRYRRLTE